MTKVSTEPKRTRPRTVKISVSPVMSIYEKAFAKSDKTDAILVVSGKKLHVNKALLSYHSEYFNTLFNSEFKEKSMEEIPIEDVKFEDFATLLSLIHEKPLNISRQNAENLLKLADRFLMNSPKLLIAIVIKNSTEFDPFDKLLLADKYGLEDLLSHIMELYDTKDKFEDFYSYSDCLSELSDATKLKLFEKYFKSGFCL